jgi:hypothetical protein
VAGMEDEIEIELNRSLTGWVRSNRYIIKSIAKYSLLFVVSGSTIKVNLDEFNLDYSKKFIRPDFEGYCKNLLEALKRHLERFVQKMKLEYITVHFVFRHKTNQYNKTVMYS